MRSNAQNTEEAYLGRTTNGSEVAIRKGYLDTRILMSGRMEPHSQAIEYFGQARGAL